MEIHLPENFNFLLQFGPLSSACQSINSSAPLDTIWRHRSGSKLVHVIACCLMAPSLYLNQCWLDINRVLCHAPESSFNALRLRQNGCHYPDDMFICIFLNENVWIAIKISLKFVPKGSINNTPALVQIMAWRQPGDKPLSEPIMVNFLMHICVNRPQWVKRIAEKFNP